MYICAHLSQLCTIVTHSAQLRTLVQSNPLALELPPLAHALLRRLDCRTPMSAVHADVAAEARVDIAVVESQWRQLFEALAGVAFLTLGEPQLELYGPQLSDTQIER